MHLLDHDPQHPPACTGIPTSMFFPDQGAAEDAFAALRICRNCPIVDACRDYAVDTFQIGIWGGTTDRQRERIRRRQTTLSRTQRRRLADRDQVRALVDHLTAQQIADRLGINIRTVERHKAALRAAHKEAA